MRIAHVTASLSRLGYGVKVAVENLSRAMSDLGHEVKVIGLEDELWTSGEDKIWQGAEPLACPTAGPKGLGYAPLMTQAIVDFEPDIVHSHGLWTLHARSVLKWHNKTGGAYVTSPHGMLTPVAFTYSKEKKALARHWFQDRMIHQSSGLHATCDAEVSEIRGYGYKGRVLVFPNGIMEQPKINVDKNTPMEAVFIGRLHDVKGPDLLLKAWSHVEASFPNWRVRIIGPSERAYRVKLETLSKTLGLKNASIEEAVPPQERDRILAGAELNILPSLNENFAISVAESLAMETPVIANKGAPWKGLEDHGCGWWIDKGVEPLAAGMRIAMKLPKVKRAEMGKRGREWIHAEFTWPRIAENALTQYQSIIDRTEHKSIK